MATSCSAAYCVSDSTSSTVAPQMPPCSFRALTPSVSPPTKPVPRMVDNAPVSCAGGRQVHFLPFPDGILLPQGRQGRLDRRGSGPALLWPAGGDIPDAPFRTGGCPKEKGLPCDGLYRGHEPRRPSARGCVRTPEALQPGPVPRP